VSGQQTPAAAEQVTGNGRVKGLIPTLATRKQAEGLDQAERKLRCVIRPRAGQCAEPCQSSPETPEERIVRPKSKDETPRAPHEHPRHDEGAVAEPLGPPIPVALEVAEQGRQRSRLCAVTTTSSQAQLAMKRCLRMTSGPGSA
jgi:hypothetical protein